MPNQFYVPGPTRVSIGQTAGSSLSFLGWTVGGVNVVLQPRHEDVFTDVSGPGVPHDVQYFGSDAIIRFTLAHYDDAVLATIRSFLHAGTEGTLASCGVGTLLRREAKAFRLFLRSPCQAKSGQTGQRGVWNFRVAYPMDAIDFNLEPRATKVRVTFRAIPDLASDGSSILYDAVTTGEPSSYPVN